jgi:hypothetical protein
MIEEIHRYLLREVKIPMEEMISGAHCVPPAIRSSLRHQVVALLIEDYQIPNNTFRRM